MTTPRNDYRAIRRNQQAEPPAKHPHEQARPWGCFVFIPHYK